MTKSSQTISGNGATVSSTRITLGNTTYPLQGIGAIRLVKRAPFMGIGLFTLAVGAIFVIAGLNVVTSRVHDPTYLLIGAAVAAGGIAAMRSREHVVAIENVAREQMQVMFNSETAAKAFVDQLHAAIDDRAPQTANRPDSAMEPGR